MTTSMETPAIVIDLGSAMSKIGLSAHPTPSCVFPSVIAIPKETSNIFPDQPEIYDIGDSALGAPTRTFKIKFPFDPQGMDMDWTSMEKLLCETFRSDLKVTPADHPVVFVESPFHPSKNREHVGQIMFEHFSVPSLYFGNSAVLSLFANGKTSGVALELGDTVSRAVPVHDGLSLHHHDEVFKTNVGGRDVTNEMSMYLKGIGHYNFLKKMTYLDTARKVKEQVCYVALDCDKEEIKEECYELPNGDVITFGKERFEFTEVLFNPNRIGIQSDGIHQITFQAIEACDVTVRKELYSNIVLSGGNSMLEGMSERVTKELQLLAPSYVQALAPSDRKHSAWIGGSMLVSMATFPKMCISKKEYHEIGTTIFHR